MKFFNLKDAQAGKPICLADGTEVKFLMCVQGALSWCNILALSPKGTIIQTSEGGFSYDEGKQKLFMLPITEKRKMWVNAYPKGYNLDCFHTSKEKADACALPGRISCIEVEYEVEIQ